MPVYTLDSPVETESVEPERPSPREMREQSERATEPFSADAEGLGSLSALVREVVTPKGFEYLELAVIGKGAMEIAKELGISREAVYDRRRTVQRQLATDPRGPAIRDAHKCGVPWRPATNTAGDVQIGRRSGGADRERLRHLPIGGLTEEQALRYGYVTDDRTRRHPTHWRTKAEACGRSRARRPSGREQDDSVPAGSPGGYFAGHHEPACDDLEGADSRIEKALARKPRMIACPESRDDFLANAVATLSPVERLAHFRRARTVRSRDLARSA